MSEQRYIGITIGPIFDTVNLASSPAALWTGSYMFSYLSRTICKLLTEKGVKEEDILSPYYTEKGDFPTDCDGVGLYHDRIIFRAKSFLLADFADVKKKAIHELAETFAMNEAYLHEYVMIHAAEFKNPTHPIVGTSKQLDGLELARTFANQQNGNELLSVLVGEKNYGNEVIKQLPLVQGFQNWQLWKDGSKESLKSISEIACSVPNSGMKKHKYYAIVRSDGDRMNQVLEKQDVNTIRTFSRKCIFYCAEVAKEVRAFGGVAIYSGGDDLLAIIPCESKDGRSVFRFLQKCNACFARHFEDYVPKPTVSFGVTICYHKFPLYEALEDSQNMLFGIAKKTRDCTAIHVQKHAGQSEALLIPNVDLEEFTKFYEENIRNVDSDWIHSAHHKLYTFRNLFIHAGKDTAYAENLFRNLFDADAHVGNHFVENALPEFYKKMLTSLGIKVVGNTKETETVDALCYMLRIFKFYTEKGDEES